MEKLVYASTGNIVECAPEIVDTMLAYGFERVQTPAKTNSRTKQPTRTTTKKAGKNESKSAKKL